MASKPKHPGIEPSNMTVPKMDRPSIWFAQFLDSFTVAYDDDSMVMYVECSQCLDKVFDITDDDLTMREMLNGCLAHAC